MQGLRSVRKRLSEAPALSFQHQAQPEGILSGRAERSGKMHGLRFLRDDVPGLRDHRGEIGGSAE